MLPGSNYVLRVPIDVSQVPDFVSDQRISVLVWNRHGYQQQRLVTFDKRSTATIAFGLEEVPESLQVAAGPESASPEDLRHLQTPLVTVPCSAWQSGREVDLAPIRVTAWDWWSWQHWRSNFRVTGELVNLLGRPVPGAEVRAFDIDAWWWWTTQEEVGRTVTDADGRFALEFARSCGWRPWWWWVSHEWQIDDALVEKITSFVRQYPGLSLLAAANSLPNLKIFQPFLTYGSRPLPSMLAATLSQAGKTIDPSALEQIRERLLEILPRRFPLPIWPWSEWAPWDDCGANLIFRVTETHGDRTAVLLQEGISRVRWDIPSCLDVKLIAREAVWHRENPDWTLVDYLFPQRRSIVPERKVDSRSAEIVRSHTEKAWERRLEL